MLFACHKEKSIFKQVVARLFKFYACSVGVSIRIKNCEYAMTIWLDSDTAYILTAIDNTESAGPNSIAP